MAIKRRRRMYWFMREHSVRASPSRLPVPVLQIVQIVGPAAHDRAQRVGAGADLDAVHHGDDHGFLPKQVVGLDVEGGALDRIGLVLGGIDGGVVLGIDKAREIRALPLVLLGRHIARMIAAHVLGRIGLGHRDLEHLDVGGEFGVGVGIGDI